VSLALATHEHFVPALSIGAAVDRPAPETFPIAGLAYGSMTRRSVQFG
jgi:4,5-DOPA dioxygenase extradiol